VRWLATWRAGRVRSKAKVRSPYGEVRMTAILEVISQIRTDTEAIRIPDTR